MLRFRKLNICFLIFCFQIFASSNIALSDGFLNEHDIQKIQTVCEINDYQIGFCSNKNLAGDTVTLRLHSIKSVVLNNRTHAFRVFATIENMSKRIILNAKLKIMFGNSEDEHLTFIIPQKIIYKDISSTKISHLIRSDVRATSKLYEKVNYIYFNAKADEIKIKPLEINFLKNQ
jgi:hypothetical protein